MQEQKTPKKPKVALPANQDQQTVQAVETQKVDPGQALGHVTIIHGANEVQYDVSGKTVKYVRDALVDVLNIDPAAAPLINGEPVGEDVVLKALDVVEFVKSSGTKGTI